MSDHTGIEWTDATWNPVTGCSHVSPGCEHCYAEMLSLRHGWSKKPWTAQNAAENVVLHPDRLTQPFAWRKPRRVFVNSMSDLFHERIPDDFLDRVFGVMAGSSRHVFQVLTKRPERMREYVRGLADIHGSGRGFARLDAAARSVGVALSFEGIPLVPWPIPNVWLGVSVEDQRRADERIPLLAGTPARVRFLSCEPLLGPIDLTHKLRVAPSPYRIHWVIVGGESGSGARPMQAEWALTIRDQCSATGAAFFFKQWGGTGNKRGHDQAMLDGVRHTAMPILPNAVAVSSSRPPETPV